MRDVVIVRYGEIALKGPHTRRRMEGSLLEAISWRLRRCGFEKHDIVAEEGRIFVYPIDASSIDVAKCLTKVFGVVSTSPALEIPNDIETIKRVAKDVATKVLENRKVESFAIRARRVESYPITSKDIEKIVGQIVKDATGLKVDLEEPDLEIFIEVREQHAYIFTEVLRGPGGLPYGIEGKCVVLFSGGMDSTLALWMMAKRGCEVVPLHMVLKPLYGDDAFEKALRVLKMLREWIPRDSFEVLLVENYGRLLKEVARSVPTSLRCLACKRLMLLIAQRIAREIGAKAIATGEVIGQVASQTLDNIYAISRNLEIPVLRPLISFDKEEIAAKLRELGLYEEACRRVATCYVVPPNPETHADPSALEPYEDLLQRLATEARVRSIAID